MSTTRFLLPLMTLIGLATQPACFIQDRGCTDSGGGDALRIDLLHDFTAPGLYELELAWDGRDVVCTWSARGTQADTAESQETVSTGCSDEGLVEVLRLLDTAAEIELLDLHPESLALRITRDGEELHSETLTPTYEVEGGERCGEDFFARVEVEF